MAGMSIYCDGLPFVSPLLNPCSIPSPLNPSSSGASTTEAELRHLFRQISDGFSNDPSRDLVPGVLGLELLTGSPPICVDHSELFERWFQKFSGGREDDPYDRRLPDLRRRIKRLTGKLLGEKIDCSLMEGEGTSSSKVAPASPKRKRDSLLDTLMVLKGVATDVLDPRAEGAAQEWKERILKVREALSLSPAVIRNRQRISQLQRGTSSTGRGGLGFQEMLNQPTRRSRRTFGLLKPSESTGLKKRVGVGDTFQADIPEWTGPPTVGDVTVNDGVLGDSRWLGTRIWPLEGEGRRTSEQMIGKGRPDSCTCSSPGSVDCIKLHVSTSGRCLKSELGQAHSDWGFDGMGEEVSKLWTDKEQVQLDELMKLNLLEGKDFLEPALEHFTSKSSKDIASYYFNVFVLTQMRNQTRLASGAADSDDDENTGEALQASRAEKYKRYLKRKPKE